MDALNIGWEMQFPPAAAKRWHKWQWAGSAPDLGAVLHRAFELGLERSCGWDLADVAPDQREAFEHAAAIYKRGVPIQGSALGRASGSYQIKLVPQLSPLPAPFVVADSGFLEAWPAWKPCATVVWTPDERQKTLEAVQFLIEQWFAHNQPQPWVIVGGGVLADTAAFTASLYGVPFVLVPTTLLAMVDACVGGKTGVNFPPFGKNQVGLFGFPQGVLVCPEFLKTLDKRQFLAGAAECLKHAFLLGDRQFLANLVNAIKEQNSEAFANLLLPLIEVKAEIVEEDPGEIGRRVVLNFGHTLAHALEGISHAHAGEVLLHGEAVALGMLFALQLSKQVAGLGEADFTLMERALRDSGCLLARKDLEARLGGSVAAPEMFERIWSLLRQDKKQLVGDGVDWILLQSFGCAEDKTRKISKDLVMKIWQDFCREAL